MQEDLEKSLSELSSNRASSQDRLWLAFQFVSGDLSSAECDVFEEAMLKDEGLCDVVIEATRLLATMSMSCEEWHSSRLPSNTAIYKRREHQPDSGPIRHWTSVTMVIAAAACLLAAAMLTIPHRIAERQFVSDQTKKADGESAFVGQTDLSSAEILLNLYALDPVVLNEAQSDTQPSSTLATSFTDSASIDDAAAIQFDDELLVPEWLFAALQLDVNGESLNDDLSSDPQDDESEIF